MACAPSVPSSTRWPALTWAPWWAEGELRGPARGACKGPQAGAERPQAHLPPHTRSCQSDLNTDFTIDLRNSRQADGRREQTMLWGVGKWRGRHPFNTLIQKFSGNSHSITIEFETKMCLRIISHFYNKARIARSSNKRYCKFQIPRKSFSCFENRIFC